MQQAYRQEILVRRISVQYVIVAASILALGCSRTDTVGETPLGAGGTQNSGGFENAGGSQNTGSFENTGGSQNTGGSKNAGGSMSVGGSSTDGGVVATGGISQTGGTDNDGGPVGTSGTTSTAGATSAAGGTEATGGAPALGGTTAAGGTSEIGDDAGDCSPPSTYRNLFAEVLSKSTADIDAKVDAAFQQLFHGSSNNVYYEVGSDQAYILDTGNNDVRSEGMSYGMMIAVQLDRKDEFDRLWRFAKQYMAQPSGFFAWHVDSSGSVLSPNPAPDGEEYFATALVFASKRWGDGSGILDYSTEAKNLLDAVANKGEFNTTEALVDFGIVVGTTTTFTDPSYVLPAFYQVWACFDSKNQALWQRAVSAGREYFAMVTDTTTGLAPEYSSFAGEPSTQPQKGDFRYDAWRVVANVMMDHHFFNADPWQTTYAARLGAFFTSQGNYGSEYTLSGTMLTAGHPAGLVGMNATLGFALPSADAAHFVQALWDVAIPTGQYRYYSGMLYMLGLLHVSGKFHLYY
jgi:endo-1,4-beta-D-glucanase Y